MTRDDARRKLATLLIAQAVNEARQPFRMFGHGVIMDAAFADVATGSAVSGMTRAEFLERCGQEWDAAVDSAGPEAMAEFAANRSGRTRTDG